MLRVFLILACARPAPPATLTPRPLDPAARAFAVRAWRAEARGDTPEAERSWNWVERLDGGFHGTLHHAEALDRLGLDAARHYREALTKEPLADRARLGLALNSEAPLGPLLAAFPCVVATSAHPDRAAAEALCAR